MKVSKSEHKSAPVTWWTHFKGPLTANISSLATTDLFLCYLLTENVVYNTTQYLSFEIFLIISIYLICPLFHHWTSVFHSHSINSKQGFRILRGDPWIDKSHKNKILFNVLLSQRMHKYLCGVSWVNHQNSEEFISMFLTRLSCFHLFIYIQKSRKLGIFGEVSCIQQFLDKVCAVSLVLSSIHSMVSLVPLVTRCFHYQPQCARFPETPFIRQKFSRLEPGILSGTGPIFLILWRIILFKKLQQKW